LVVLGGLLLTLLLRSIVSSMLMHDEVKAAAERQLKAAVSRTAEDIDARIALRRAVLLSVAEAIGADKPPMDRAALLPYIDSRHALGQLFDFVYVVDRRGHVLAARPETPGSIGLDLSDREYVQAVSGRVKPYLSKPYRTRLSQRAAVSFAVPIVSADGSYGGALIGVNDLSAAGLLDGLREARIGDSGFFRVTTADRVTLVHQDASRVLTPAVVDDAAAVSVSQRLQEAPWVVQASLPAEEAFAVLWRLQAVSAVFGAAAAVLLAVVVWMVTAASVTPLTALGRQIDEIEAGRRSGDVEVSGADEIVHVARAFNRLLKTTTRLQLSLREREEFHRLLTDGSPLGIFLVDADSQVNYVNPRVVAWFGRPAVELLGEGWLQCVHPDDRLRLAQEWAAARAAQRGLDIELRLATDGDTRWLQLNAVPLPGTTFDGSSGVDVAGGGYVGALADITAQKQSLAEAESEKKRNDRIMSAIADALIVVDAALCVVHMSPAAERLIGWLREGVVGASLTRVLRLYEDQEGAMVDLRAVLTQYGWEGRLLFCDSAQQPRLPVEVSWTPLREGSEGGGVLALREARNAARSLEVVSPGARPIRRNGTGAVSSAG
jgi:diguanylate cyclase